MSAGCNVPGGYGVALGEGDLVAVERVEHLRQLWALLAEQRPLAALLHLPPADHAAERVRVHPEGERVDRLGCRSVTS